MFDLSSERKNLWPQFLAAGVAVVLAWPVGMQAAEIRKKQDTECDYELSGPIIRGDADKLRNIELRGNLCLDSLGGSFEEALNILDYLSTQYFIPTRIKSGSKCLSACALIFMGGSYTEDTKYPLRVLEPGAVLGFHSPSLDIKESGLLYESAVVESAYATSLQQISRLIIYTNYSFFGNIRLERLFPAELLQRMLKHNGNKEFYYIEKIEDLIISQVSYGLSINSEMDGTNLQNVCNNYFWIINLGDANSDSRENPYNTQESGISIKINNEEYTEFADYPGSEGEQRSCFVRQSGEYFHIRFDSSTATDILLPSYFGLPLAMPLSAIKFTPTKEARNSNVSNIPRCFVISKLGQVIDNEPCEIEIISGSVIGINNATVTYFKWPSGGKSVLVSQKDKETINGVPTSGRKHSDYTLCYFNKTTGNDFCYKR